jgi:hypothetical protein
MVGRSLSISPIDQEHDNLINLGHQVFLTGIVKLSRCKGVSLLGYHFRGSHTPSQLDV